MTGAHVIEDAICGVGMACNVNAEIAGLICGLIAVGALAYVLLFSEGEDLILQNKSAGARRLDKQIQRCYRRVLWRLDLAQRTNLLVVEPVDQRGRLFHLGKWPIDLFRDSAIIRREVESLLSDRYWLARWILRLQLRWYASRNRLPKMLARI